MAVAGSCSLPEDAGLAGDPMNRPEMGEVSPESDPVRGRDAEDKLCAEALRELNTVSITEVLEHDSRPTFIIDLDPDLDILIKPDVLTPLFCNAALRSHDLLLEVVRGETILETFEAPDATYADFRSWVKSVTKHDDTMDVFPLSVLYGGMLWTGSTIRKRWRLISGNRCYRASGAASADLSSGPPSEVATSGVVAQMSDLASSMYNLRQSKSVSASEFNRRLKASVISSSSVTTYSKEITSSQKRPLRSFGRHGSSWKSIDTESTASVMLDIPESGVPDWTLPEPRGVLSGHMRFARSIDWASTPLGPMTSWSAEFRQMMNLLLTHRHPAALFWGNEMTVVYNEAYRDKIAGRKHPDLMGTGFKGPFSEMWDDVGQHFAECARTGYAVAMENQMIPIERHGFMEETYFTWSATPIYGGTPKILGFYNAPFETTREIIGNRRILTLQRLGEKVAMARTTKEFWGKVLEGLEDNPYDMPLVLLYSVVDIDDGKSSSHSPSSSSMSTKSCVFGGALGIPKDHPAAPPQLDLKRSREGFIPSFREAMRTREPTKLQTRDGTLPESLLEGIEWRGFGEPCREAVICPVRPTNGESVLGFLLLGVNPRRPYDDEYRSFMDMLNRQLATSLASTMLYEEETRRGKTAAKAAALEQEHLNEQLAVQTGRLQRMTELSPVGLFYINPEGIVLEANDRWYDMIGRPKDNGKQYSWLQFIREDYQPALQSAWENMVMKGVPWSGEVQLKRKWMGHVSGDTDDYWILGSAHPEYGSDGSMRSVMGSITDINHIKWAERLQNRRLKEAEETRRQQNEFIDITSHEMRNPLSAILQCADDISASLAEYQTGTAKPSIVPETVLLNCIDAANTVVLCAQHQKCIVDDILTISKLDSNLLIITPVVVQPVAVAQRAVKMFDSEIKKKNIEMKFVVHKSLRSLEVDWAVLDPSRLLQVLINLLTNAIKFTQTRPKRLITVRVTAFQHPPSDETADFEYIPQKSGKANVSLFGDDWGSGESLYLQFEVQDTGRGLTIDEKKLLFMRFSQASPRTHAQYGGSGLGLFISRQLTELHGGQIGVASEAGVGSTFAFYIEAKRYVSEDANQVSMGSPINADWRAGSYISQMVQSGDPYINTPLSISRSVSASKKLIKVPRAYHVLIVEDNLVNQKVMSKQLQKAGCTVNVASHGEEALEYLEKTTFWKINRGEGHQLSVILMDLEMPIMDGLTCVRKIRSMETEGTLTARIPVIAVTANVRFEQINAARGSGMDDVVSKPFRIPELIAKIELLLNAKN